MIRPLLARVAGALVLVAACSSDPPRPVEDLMITGDDLPTGLEIQRRELEPGVEACAGVLDLASARPGTESAAADILGPHAFFIEVHRYDDADEARTAFIEAIRIAEGCTGSIAFEPDGTTTRFTIDPVDLDLYLPDDTEVDARHHLIANAFEVELDIITIRFDDVVALAGGTDRATTVSMIELIAARAAETTQSPIVPPDGFYEARPADDLDQQLGEADPATLFRLAVAGIPRLTPESVGWVTRASDSEIERLGSLACGVVAAAGSDIEAQDAALIDAWDQLTVEEQGVLDPGSFGQLAAAALVVYCPEVALDINPDG
ncbi:MAG: hypothetical protein GY745_11545 [Actinomycetia bacterium]|nr:hypothetical protein [Actinomycetes bacterium]